MLSASNLTKQYDNVLSVDSLTFTIEKGEVVGLLGANGAGKSTTMNMITGCIPPSSGTVMVFGHDMHWDPIPAKRHIGYLPEIPPLYTDMTVTEQLLFACSLRSVTKAARKSEVDRACELVNIGDVRKRVIRQLSKGYRQRVGMAQALVGSPELLVFDEPTAGLDPKQIIDIRQLILKLKERHTIILSSHILAEITSVCTRLLIMKGGKLVADSTPEQLGNAHAGGNQLELRIKGGEIQVHPLLTAIPGVAELRLETSPEPGCVDVLVTAQQGKDLREAIFFALAAASCPVVMMRPAKPTLEEIFIRLTA